MKCKLCRGNNTVSKEDVVIIQGIPVKLLYTECEDCGAEFIPVDQIRENDQRIKETMNEINN